MPDSMMVVAPMRQDSPAAKIFHNVFQLIFGHLAVEQLAARASPCGSTRFTASSMERTRLLT